MTEALLIDIIFGLAIGLITSAMFYVLVAHTDVFGLLLAASAFICFELLTCRQGTVSAIVFCIVASPGAAFALFDKNETNAVNQLVELLKKMAKSAKLTFHRFFGKKTGAGEVKDG